jgi:coniferyl-aldehyde dehydrogenase
VTTVDSMPVVAGDEWTPSRLESTLERMVAADRRDGPPSLAVRRDRLDRLALAILEHVDELADAVDKDFGGRSPMATRVGEIATCVQGIVEARRNLRSWMRPRRPAPKYLALGGVRAHVEPHPLGVVGVISPWNFPVALAIQPVIAAIAAGNRVLLKPSELTHRTSDVLAKALGQHFDEDELVVVTGGVDVGIEFSRLPFDHLLFTGASEVGRQIAMAAAERMVPVTLELGGKNPAVVGPGADHRRAARRIATARLANSGQICLSPDYVLVPRAEAARFVDLLVETFRERVPNPADDAQYCAIVNDRHFARITGLLDDARSQGATVIPAADGETVARAAERGRIVPTVVTTVSDEMAIAHDEVFGPVLVVVPYDDVDQAIDHVNARPAPLAAYWFGDKSAAYRRFTARTRSGGVTRNDFALHAALEGLPFGGVGNSGTGYYHGRFGFDTFSHLRAIASSPRLFSPVAILSPPFSARLDRILTSFLGRYRRRLARRVRRAQEP